VDIDAAVDAAQLLGIHNRHRAQVIPRHVGTCEVIRDIEGRDQAELIAIGIGHRGLASGVTGARSGAGPDDLQRFKRTSVVPGT
jgi:hypothetical protein